MRNDNRENMKRDSEGKREFYGRKSGTRVFKNKEQKFSASDEKKGRGKIHLSKEEYKHSPRKVSDEENHYDRAERRSRLTESKAFSDPDERYSTEKRRKTVGKYRQQPSHPYQRKRVRSVEDVEGNKHSYTKRSENSASKSRSVQDGSIRLNRYLANAGVCSRREADVYIQAGVVSVNGQVVSELGSRVFPEDEVRFHEQLLTPERKIYVLLNKPKGYVTTTEDPHARQTVMELVREACHERIYPVGRLDKATTGVLLLTNDGELAKKLTHPKYKCRKIYQVTLDKKLRYEDMLTLAKGIELDDGFIAADAVQYVDAADYKVVGVEIHSGRNRIVRRMFENLGYQVEKLDRVMFAGLTKSKVPRGAWRFLTEKEIAFLKMGNF